MALVKDTNQYTYSGKGPLDTKSLVKTYSELIDINTWTKDDTFVAYNGMIVAVWLNKDDTSKNGVYFLFDPAITNVRTNPDVTNESNWHRLDKNTDINSEIERITAIEEDIVEVREDISDLEESQTESFERRDSFPESGIVNKIYIALDEQKSYVWDDSTGYICISGSTAEMPQIQIICGGSANYVVD